MLPTSDLRRAEFGDLLGGFAIIQAVLLFAMDRTFGGVLVFLLAIALLWPRLTAAADRALTSSYERWVWSALSSVRAHVGPTSSHLSTPVADVLDSQALEAVQQHNISVPELLLLQAIASTANKPLSDLIRTAIAVSEPSLVRIEGQLHQATRPAVRALVMLAANGELEARVADPLIRRAIGVALNEIRESKTDPP